jgi:hypothetical protein
LSAAKPATRPAAAEPRAPARRDVRDSDEKDKSEDERPPSSLRRVAHAILALFKRTKAAFLAGLVAALDAGLAMLGKLRQYAAPNDADESDRDRGGAGTRGPAGRRDNATTKPPAQVDPPKPKRLRRLLVYLTLIVVGGAAGFYISRNPVLAEFEPHAAEPASPGADAADSKKSATESESDAERQKADNVEQLKALEEQRAEIERIKAEQATQAALLEQKNAEIERIKTEQGAQANLLEQQNAEIERRKTENAEQAKQLADNTRQFKEEQSRHISAESRLQSNYLARAEPAGRSKASASPASGDCAINSGDVGASLKRCLSTLNK